MVLQPSVLGIIDNILRTKNIFIKYSQIITEKVNWLTWLSNTQKCTSKFNIQISYKLYKMYR
jgi:hypothetical protein